jgi:hypothetical protein
MYTESRDITGELPDPVRPTLSGDYKDDDGTYIDDLFTPNPNTDPAPAFPIEDPRVSRADLDNEKAPTITRVIPTKVMVDLSASTDPVLLFPPDACRKVLYIQADAAFYWGSDRINALMAPTFTPPTGNIPLKIEGHTGGLYVLPVTGIVHFNGWAITE